MYTAADRLFRLDKAFFYRYSVMSHCIESREKLVFDNPDKEAHRYTFFSQLYTVESAFRVLDRFSLIFLHATFCDTNFRRDFRTCFFWHTIKPSMTLLVANTTSLRK
jgi:hypothetical protein